MSTPENYFDRAVLNTNTLVGFANDGLQRELDQPSMKMVNGDKDHPVQMKRREIMDNKIRFLEEDMGKLNGLKETDDTREMLQTSKALNEYVLAVYKNEYQQLAKLYDDIADKDQVQSLIQSIHDKYYAGFDELYKKLIAIGKSYAEKHSIKVNWAN
ncbi:MAG: hypothetical protein WDO16_20680 [Bacteroidota bacterium]